jgi:hypothetical protein
MGKDNFLLHLPLWGFTYLPFLLYQFYKFGSSIYKALFPRHEASLP